MGNQRRSQTKPTGERECVYRAMQSEELHSSKVVEAFVSNACRRNGKGVRQGGERLSNSMLLWMTALGFIRDHFRRRLVHFELGTHFLDLSGLLFELGRQYFHPFLLLRDGGCQLLNFFVLLDELVEQHRVDLLATDRVGLAFFVHRYQSGVHFCYFFSYQAKLGRVRCVVLVVEGHWFQREDCFTGRIHRVNVLLEPLRRHTNTQLTGRPVNRYVASERAVTNYSRDIAVTYETRVSEADRSVFGRNADTNRLADVDVIGAFDVLSRLKTHDGVVNAGLVC